MVKLKEKVNGKITKITSAAAMALPMLYGSVLADTKVSGNASNIELGAVNTVIGFMITAARAVGAFIAVLGFINILIGLQGQDGERVSKHIWTLVVGIALTLVGTLIGALNLTF
jgi:hypothetical protein